MAGLRAGYGEAVITPPLAVDLTGYGFYLDRRAESVLDDLKARALYLSYQKTALLIISCDIVCLTVESCDSLRKSISRRSNIPTENILITTIHTHTGPAVHSMPGLGEPDLGYMSRLPGLIQEAAAKAVEDAQSAKFEFGAEICEPIGYNRRKNSFSGVDPALWVGIFKRRSSAIYLLNYACHPVVLGRQKVVSADWPGALVKEIERTGNRGIFLQGFCGDIDPVTNWNEWGSGTEEDLRILGQMLSHRAFKVEKRAKTQMQPRLRALEKRIQVPLQVCAREEMEKQAQSYLESNKQFRYADRMVAEWRRKAKKGLAALARNPFLTDVPIQAMAIGGLKIIGIPGEVFCEYGIALRKKWPQLMTVGYANGDVGYIPTEEAFADPTDYACYAAPAFYALFPFRPDIESFLLQTSDEMLAAL
jgi:hypothetical protein